MTFKSLLAAGLAIVAISLAVPALAQAEATTTPAAVEQPATVPPEQNWLKVCSPLADGKRACLMRQVIVTQGKQFMGSFILRDDPGQQARLTAVAAVPVGVLLPMGLYWQIDDGKPIRTDYFTCDPLSCSTQQFVNEKYIDMLKKGTVLKLIAKNRKNEDLIVSINLAGFTAVYDGEAALTFDELNKQQSGQAALEKMLQDRAEALRQQLDGEGQTPPPAQ
ncbi:MAG: invasion associated locus B family protein [Devosia sp.]